VPTREEVIAELRSRRASAPMPQEAELTASDGVAGAIQGVAQGASWGAGDELLAGLSALGAYGLDKLQVDRLLGGEVDKSLGQYYDSASSRYSGQVKEAAKKTPGLFLAGNVVGAVGTGGALAPTKAATAIGNSLRTGGVGARIAKGYAAGAASMGAANIATGEGDIIDRAKNAGFDELSLRNPLLTGGGLGGLIPGVGATVRGTIDGIKNAAGGAAARGAGQLDEALGAIRETANAAYAQMRQSGATLKPLAGAQVIDDLTQALKASGPLNKKIHGQTLSVVKDLKALAKKGQLGLEEIDQYRQLFGDLAGDFNNKANARTAGILRDAIDDSLDGLSDGAFSAGSKDALGALKEGRAAFARSRKFETVADIVKKSDGDANYVKRELTKLLNNPKKVRGFNTDERKALAEAAKLGGGEALLKIAGKFGFDTARLGAGAGAIMGSAGGAALGGASGAAIVPAIGTGARYGQKLLARGKAENLLRVIEQGGKGTASAAGAAVPAITSRAAITLPSANVAGNIGAQINNVVDDVRGGASPKAAIGAAAARAGATQAPTREEVLQLLRERRKTQGVGEQSALPANIQSDEGKRLTAYTDTTGNKTVGIGFNMDSPNAKRVWQKAGMQSSFDDVYAGGAGLSESEAYQLAGASYKIALDDARALVKDFDDLSDVRKKALVNMSYQLGKPRMAEFQAALGHINSGQYIKAARQILKSKYAKQTPERARRIALMIAKG
jgi:lysozyme